MLRVPGVKYIGVDIVAPLIAHDQRLHGDADTEFVCLDFLRDELPRGELYLVRQVLQHLSNDEIHLALSRLDPLPLVLVTEHQPAPSRTFKSNADKPHGPDTRLVDGSGVFLEEPPFSRKVQVVFEANVQAEVAGNGEVLRTVMICR